MFLIFYFINCFCYILKKLFKLFIILIYFTERILHYKFLDVIFNVLLYLFDVSYHYACAYIYPQRTSKSIIIIEQNFWLNTNLIKSSIFATSFPMQHLRSSSCEWSLNHVSRSWFCDSPTPNFIPVLSRWLEKSNCKKKKN